MHGEQLLQIGIAARRWYEADEQRRLAAARLRKATPPAGVHLPFFSPQYYERQASEAALTEAKKEERSARRALKRLCASGAPDVVDVVPAAQMVSRRALRLAGAARDGITDVVAH